MYQVALGPQRNRSDLLAIVGSEDLGMVLCREELRKVSSRLGVEASDDPGEGGTVHFVIVLACAPPPPPPLTSL